MLSAAENLRRSLETAVKVQEAVMDGVQIERFHEVLIEEIGRCEPGVAARIVERLQAINAAWSA